MSLLAIQKLGRNRDTPRLWLESRRLESLGFSPGVPLGIEARTDELILRPAILAENHVSSRATPGGRRPIIDLASQSLLAGLSEYSELKIIASFERIVVTPSQRAFGIRKSRSLEPPFRVLEVFAGGGTMTEALLPDARYRVIAGVEFAPDYADEWQAKHSDAMLIQADLRALQTPEFPEFDLIIGGIPCTSHSNLGRAKHGLAGKPELGDSGDLFLPVLALVSERMPAAAVFENVPSFGTSLAGELLVSHLRRIGYHVFTTILQPNTEWAEIGDRKRWLLVATLERPFELRVPGLPCASPVSMFLDEPDAGQDRADAGRIAGTIAGLREHNARHQAAGHGFGFSVVDGSELRLPTVPKSYHKINSGPFVKTPYGLRLLRQTEIERLHGCQLRTRHYATAVQMLGQGVQTGLFRGIFSQVADHLALNG